MIHSANNGSQRVPLTQYQQIPQQQSSELGGYAGYAQQDNGMLNQNTGHPGLANGAMGEDRMQSAQVLLDPDLVTQVYQAYAAQLGRDRNAKIQDVLAQEPFFSLMQQGLFSEMDIEAAVFQKIYAEEESADIQQMIAQFYNKFDELHEQSLTQALAKSPNKVMIKNEVKYRIPERWTKKFHKQDVVSMEILQGQSIPEERGNINQNQIVTKRNDYESRREQSLAD